MHRSLAFVSSVPVLLLGIFVAFFPAYAACEGKATIFADDFIHPSPSWGPGSKEVFRGGKYVMTVEPNATVADWPDAPLFSGSYSVCVKIKLPQDPKGEAGSGVIFWVDPLKNKQGGRNLYMAMISPDGFYWVTKQADGTKSNVVEPAQSDVVKIGPGAVNEIVVTLRDDRATFVINDKAVGDFAGGPSQGQFHAGILAGAPLEKKYQVEFSDFRVVRQ